MLDITKYFETQKALAEKKITNKNQNKIDNVSQKSKYAADTISKQQEKSFNHSVQINSEDDIQSKPNTSVETEQDSETEYAPSSDEEEEAVLSFEKGVSFTESKRSLKKITDDGDKRLYNERLQIWKKNLGDALLGNYNEVQPSSADIRYILLGNNDIEETHEYIYGLQIPTYIWKQLYKYQRAGVNWLWELHQLKSGALLGDEMGLGKTVQIIAFLVALSKTDVGLYGGLGPSIIVAPATVIYQWVSHFHYWYPPFRVAVLHHSGSHSGSHNKLIREIHMTHGILLVTYAGMVKYKELLELKWHYIILDEGHKIRNPDTQISKLVRKVVTPHRLIITGSPMQNSLQELWSLFDFMVPGLLGTQNVFMDFFALPITQGGYANATEFQESTALEIAKALKNIITPYMLRRTKTEVQKHIQLPEKNEQVLFCALSQEQRDLYMGYLVSGTVRSILEKECRFGDPVRARILVAISTLRKICNHPDLYLYEVQDDIVEINEETFGHWKRSGKMQVVHSLLKIWQKQGHRALIFSQSRAMICLLEQYLLQHNFKYLKMDGSVSVGVRQNIIKTFNENCEYHVFLATTRVGGLGVNLTGANRVIIYDPDWNPATDSQAKERAWRIGQQKNVTVYRLLSAGTIEEKIYQRQVFKQLLCNKVFINPNQRNVLTTSTLQGLFTLDEPNKDGDTETPNLFKHTKVNIKHKNTSNEKHDDIHLSGEVSFSKNKLEAMRRKAREISNKIKSMQTNTQPVMEDPRERYKRKRELLLNPPLLVEPEHNLVDDHVTNVPFENIISEFDIINMHTKDNYEQNLISDLLKNQTEENNCDEKTSNDEIAVSPELIRSEKLIRDVEPNSKLCTKRRHSSSKKDKIDNIVAIKKVKNKKFKKGIEDNDDDYVLSKLFAKSTVKNALQHDVIVGLAEKERIYRIKEEALKKAKEAVRAIRFSSK